MSYNVDSTEMRGALTISAAAVLDLRIEHKIHLPMGGCFLNDLYEKAYLHCADGQPDEQLQIHRFAWSGDWSGISIGEGVLEKVAKHLRGQADVLFTWEGGDSTSGYRIDNGTITECNVTWTLTPKETATP